MSNMAEIEKLTKDFSDARKTLSDRVQAFEDEKQVIMRTHLRGIKKAVEIAMEKKALLHAAIEESPELFKQPRTLILYGVKFGFQKQKGKIEWEDADYVVARIKKVFQDNWQDYLKITEKPSKTALAELTVADLKKLGVTAEETGDAVLIKATDSEIDKLVNALLKDEEMEEVEA